MTEGIPTVKDLLHGLTDSTGREPTGSENRFDWYASPRAPFRPSRADYRRAVRGGETAYRLLEVPSFVSESIPWALVSGLQLARKTGSVRQLWNAIRRPTYSINVTARPVFFAPLRTQLRPTLRPPARGPLVFATQFHADELLPNRSRLYDIRGVRTNLAALLRACDEARTPVQFVQARHIAALWSD